MKANEAPQKLYLSSTGKLGDGISTGRLIDTDIEYIRTDTFIKKAEEFIYSALNDGIMGTANIEDFMRLFKNYMKGQ